MTGQLAPSALCSLSQAAQSGACTSLLAQLRVRSSNSVALGTCRCFATPSSPSAAGASALTGGAAVEALQERRASHNSASSSQQRGIHSTAQPHAQPALQHQEQHYQQGSFQWGARIVRPTYQQQQQWQPQPLDPGLAQQLDDIQFLKRQEREQQHARDRLRDQREAALAAAPSAAHAALRGLAAALDLQPPELAKLAAAAKRNSAQLQTKGAPWLSEPAARALAGALTSRAALDAKDAAELLARCPAALRAAPGTDALAVLGALQRHAYPGGAAGAAPAAGGPGAPLPRSEDLGQLLLRAPQILRAPPAAVEANLRYLASTLALPPAAVRAALAAHPPLASAKAGSVAINMAFLVGLGATSADLRAMVERCPRWATMPLRELTVKWQFFRQELKVGAAVGARGAGKGGVGVCGAGGRVRRPPACELARGDAEARVVVRVQSRCSSSTVHREEAWSAWLHGTRRRPPQSHHLTSSSPLLQPLSTPQGTLEDLVLAPQLLQLSLLDTLGPRAGLAKKKRVKLLMPSYSAGHPILKRPREWAQHRMAPVRYWMTASPPRLGKTMGLDPEEVTRYQEAWKMTTGDRWRRLVLSPTARGGGGGAGDAGAQLVTLPQSARDDDVRGFGAAA